MHVCTRAHTNANAHVRVHAPHAGKRAPHASAPSQSHSTLQHESSFSPCILQCAGLPLAQRSVSKIKNSAKGSEEMHAVKHSKNAIGTCSLVAKGKKGQKVIGVIGKGNMERGHANVRMGKSDVSMNQTNSCKGKAHIAIDRVNVELEKVGYGGEAASVETEKEKKGKSKLNGDRSVALKKQGKEDLYVRVLMCEQGFVCCEGERGTDEGKKDKGKPNAGKGAA